MIRSGLVENSNVKFISYTGRWPNLCSGILTLEINGKTYKFGYSQKYPKFWYSGGSCGFKDRVNWESYINYGDWEIDVDDLPEELRKYASEIDRVFNENVEPGCCGGCL